MLERLQIKNIALIEECSVTFGAGLNILTGETGAGKSMLMDSLLFALGNRAGKELIRHGQKSAHVEALFTIEEGEILARLERNGVEIDETGELLLTRTIQETGKSVCRANGSMVTIGMLRELTEGVIDIYGQHDHQSLLNPSKHIQMLDRFCSAEFYNVMSEYKTCYKALKNLEKQLQELVGEEGQREQRLDILRFQINEIEGADLTAGEEDELSERKKRANHHEKLLKSISESIQLLYDGEGQYVSVCDALSGVLGKLNEVLFLDDEIQVYHQTLNDAFVQIEDSARELKRFEQSLTDEPDNIDEIEERLALIYRLKRKYGHSIAEILTFWESAKDELARLENSEVRVNELVREKAKEEMRIRALAQTLTQLRTETAKRVGVMIEETLHEMEMKNAKFSISVTSKDIWGSDGCDRVEFLISPNVGEKLKPLSQIASGGEMSRIMLALKSVLVDADEIDTFIFDEIDAGVSGRTAAKVGKLMNGIGKKRQVICITHLPQIAAMADMHFKIEKKSIGERTLTEVFPLEEEDSVLEIARLLGGEAITETTLAAAKELREEKGRAV